MRVGVYIDGFNLYYGGRAVVANGRRNQPGWRWLDLRKLSQRLIDRRREWRANGAVLDRVIYCTAFIDGNTNPEGRRDQDRYVAALRAHGSIDALIEGRFISQVRKSPLAIEGSDGKPVVTTSRWPVMIRDSSWGDVPNAMFIVSHQRSEEKGTDVNVASRLLLDVLGEQVDAAIVISNDSDLRLPIQESRLRVPVGTVNPGQGRLAGDLAGGRDDGVGMHWWYKLDSDDYTGCQLPDPVKQFAKPADW